MKKIKILLMSAMLALTIVAVLGLGLKASAATAHDYGDYKVTKTKYENDTANWDFTKTTTDTTLATGDTINGGILADVTNGSVKARPGYYDVYSSTSEINQAGGKMYVPVPAESAGKILVTSTGDNASRHLYVNGDATKVIANSTTASSYTFTSTDITTKDSVTYLELVGWCTDAKKKEIKIASIQVVLTTGAYPATAKLYNVTYHDGAKTTVEEVEEGTAIANIPTKWGYDLKALYTDEALSQAYEQSTPVTSDLNLYTDWTAWAEGTIKNPNVLDLELMQKGLDVFNVVAMASDTALEGTNYTLLSGSTAFAASAEAIGEHGTSTAAIKTGGAMTDKNFKNGVALKATGAGTLTVYIKSSNTEARTLDVYTETSALHSTGSTAKDIAPLTVEIPEAGTYYIGAAGSIYMYYIEFVEAPAVNAKLAAQFADDTTKTDLRLLGTLEGIEDLAQLTNVKFVLTLKKADGSVVAENREVAVSTLYREVTGLEGFAAAENTYYAVFVITELQAVVTNLAGASIEASLSYTYNGEAKTVSMNNAINLIVA